MKRILVLVAAACLMTQSISAANYSNEIMAIGVGARALGMGGAFAAVADDSTAVYWNPAGIGIPQTVRISLSNHQTCLQNRIVQSGADLAVTPAIAHDDAAIFYGTSWFEI